jgi:hypothetical protein
MRLLLAWADGALKMGSWRSRDTKRHLLTLLVLLSAATSDPFSLGLGNVQDTRRTCRWLYAKKCPLFHGGCLFPMGVPNPFSLGPCPHHPSDLDALSHR